MTFLSDRWSLLTEGEGYRSLSEGGEEGKGGRGKTSSTPKTVAKSVKRKPDGSDGRPSKKAAVTPRDSAPKEKSPLKPSHGAGKGVMTSSGPANEGPCCLLTHKDYAVGEVGSFIKPTDIESCDLLGTDDLGASALFDLTRALVRVKALQDRCVAKEGVVTQVRKHNTNLMNEQGQYKDAVRTLNQQLKEVKEKLAEGNCQKEKLQEEVTDLGQRVQMG